MPDVRLIMRHHVFLRGRDVVLVAAALMLDLLIWGSDGHTRLGFVVPPPVVYSTAIATFVLLLRRRQHPWVAFLSVWAYSVCWGALLPTYQPFTGLLIAIFQFARYTDARTARQPLPLLIVPWTINSYNAVVASTTGAFAAAVTAAVWAAIAATVWLAGRAAHRTQLFFELQSAKQAVDAELALQQHQLRLARELHDIVAHSISAVMFQAAGARAAAKDLDPQVDGALRAIQTSSTQASRELRQLLGLLEPSTDATPAEPAASLAALDQLLETTRSCAVDVRLSDRGQHVPLDPSIDHTAYKVVQEALANTMKHGGEGAHAGVDLRWEEDGLCITVRSETGPHAGMRKPEGPSGYGLRGLRQRVLAVGGRLDAGPIPGGFLVVADLPVVSGGRTGPPA